MIRENEYLYLIRKPTGIASTRWDQSCMLDRFSSLELFSPTFDDLWGVAVAELFRSLVDECQIVPSSQSFEEILAFLSHEFSKEEEYGLRNRLDTPTSWRLYFAKNRDVFTHYPQRQQTQQIEKIYLCRVRWDPLRWAKKLLDLGESATYLSVGWTESCTISFPIAHHRHDPHCMISSATALWIKKLPKQSRGEIFRPQTQITRLTYDTVANESLVRVMIHQGVRHQIRVHLSTLGTPILGDTLYSKVPWDIPLQLVSAGRKKKSSWL